MTLPLDLLEWRGKLAVLMHQCISQTSALDTPFPSSDGSLYISCSINDDAGFGGCSTEQLDMQFAYILILPFHRADQAKDLLIPKIPHGSEKTTPSGVMIKY